MQAPPPAALKPTSNISVEAPPPYNHEEPPRAFPTDLPARTHAPKRRHFLKMSWSSYKTRGPGMTARTRWRHICMIFILVLSTIISIELIFTGIYDFSNIPAIVIYSLMAIAGFWLQAACLPHIGDAEGTRWVIGRSTIGRKGLDIFLCVFALFDMVLAGCWPVGLILVTGTPLAICWVAGWVAVWLMAGIARRPSFEYAASAV